MGVLVAVVGGAVLVTSGGTVEEPVNVHAVVVSDASGMQNPHRLEAEYFVSNEHQPAAGYDFGTVPQVPQSEQSVPKLQS